MGTFGDNRIEVIPYHPFNEPPENFIANYFETIRSAAFLIYFDDVIAGGRTFKLISDYLKNTTNKYLKYTENLDEGFDLVITLLDRSTSYAKEEIRRKLATIQNPHAEKLFLSYFKLNVPQLEVNTDDPVKQQDSSLRDILNVSHLDALKIYSVKEILKNAPKKVSQITEYYKNNVSLQYFPFAKSPSMFQLYESRYTLEHRNVLKLHLFHKISRWFAEKETFSVVLLEELLKELRKEDNRDLYFKFESKDDQTSRYHAMEEELVNEIALRLLARAPFKDYQRIHEVVLAYNNTQLNEILEKIVSLYATIGIRQNDADERPKKRRILFEDFHKFTTHIKRSVELNGNFILSEHFLAAVKTVFLDEALILEFYTEKISLLNQNSEYGKRLKRNYEYQGKQLIRFKYFLLRCYKELIFKNPARSIVLEKLLNQKKLQPFDQLSDTLVATISLKRLMADSYYHLWRILKSENIYLFNELKSTLIDNLFISDIFNSTHHPVFKTGMNWEAKLNLVKGFFSGAPEEEQRLFFTELKRDENFKSNLQELVTDIRNADQFEDELKSVLIRTWLRNRYLLDPAFEDETARQAKKFIQETSANGSDNLATTANALLSMLYTVMLLNNKRNTRHPRRKLQQEEDSFVREVKRILAAATQIIGDGLEYAFFIEYRERKDEKDTSTDNIFTIVSKESPSTRQPKLSANGLVYQMLYGLTDFPEGNVQTLLAVAKDEKREIISLKNTYYTYSHAQISDPLEKQKDVSAKAVHVASAYQADCFNHGTGLQLFDQAKMCLYFRLADVNVHDGKGKITGQAVLVIYNDHAADAKSFLDFANVEKMRLLLLIKEQMLQYLKRHFESDAFISILEDRSFFQTRLHMDHGLGAYKTALEYYYAEAMDLCNKNDLLTEDKQQNLWSAVKRLGGLFGLTGKSALQRKYRHDMQYMQERAKKMNIVINAVLGQVDAAVKTDVKEIDITSDEDFREHILLVLGDEYLGNNDIDMRLAKVDRVFPSRIYRVIYNIVIPELLINLKRHSPLRYDGDPEISVTYQDRTLKFSNRMRIESNVVPKKPLGGIAMCNQLLLSLNLPQLYITIDTEKKHFNVDLKLYHPEHEKE